MRIKSAFLCKEVFCQASKLSGFGYGIVGLPISMFELRPPLDVRVHDEVSPTVGPLFVLFSAERSDQPPRRLHGWEDAHDFLAPTDLLNKSLYHVGGADPPSVLRGKGQDSRGILEARFQYLQSARGLLLKFGRDSL